MQHTIEHQSDSGDQCYSENRRQKLDASLEGHNASVELYPVLTRTSRCLAQHLGSTETGFSMQHASAQTN